MSKFNIGDRIRFSKRCIDKAHRLDAYVHNFSSFVIANKTTIFTIKDIDKEGSYQINVGSDRPNAHRDGWWLEEPEMEKAVELPEDLFTL